MEFVIDKNIPIPTATRNRATKYPWADMKVGDSFFVPGKPKALYASARGRGIKIAVRPDKQGRKDGVRVWRVGDVATPKKRGRAKKVS